MTETESYLNRIPMWASKKNSLPHIRDFLEQSGCREELLNIIHVAGTNGKGSVCSYMTSILTEAGYRVGTFISPHLVTVRERFLINGEAVEEAVFESAFQKVKRLSETMRGRGYEAPSYFEFLFYMFMIICQEEQPDFVILETGLGGLLDTTNVIRRPVLTVITSISMDHMQYLGDTVPKIAAQKAGILKPQVPVVYDGSSREGSQVIRERAGELGCPAWEITEKDYTLAGRDEAGARILIETGTGPLEVRITSRADYQMINGTLAVKSLDVLRTLGKAVISDEAVKAGVEKSFWPARMEEILPGVYLDGAHNIGGMEALTRTIGRMQQETGKPVTLMFGVASDKEYHEMIRKLCSTVRISRVTIARMDTDRSASTEELARDFRRWLGCPVDVFDTVGQAWEHFLREKGGSLAFCAGSLYLAGEVKALCTGEGDGYDRF